MATDNGEAPGSSAPVGVQSRGRTACVLGGTGFLGRRVVRQFAEKGHSVRVAARDPHKASFSDVEEACLERVCVDVRDESAVERAVQGAHCVVNALSLYVEKPGLSFHEIHVEAAGRIARLSRKAEVEFLSYVSGIGADTASPSELIRAKAQGEQLVASEFPKAFIVRPSVMFAPDDAFVRKLDMASRTPVVPLFGTGEFQMQPAWVVDVAKAIVALSSGALPGEQTLEFGGAQTLSYREAVEAVCRILNRRRLLLPVPIDVWKVLIGMLSVLPQPPLTIDQLHLLVQDNTVAAERDGFSRLAIQPCALKDLLADCLRDHESAY